MEREYVPRKENTPNSIPSVANAAAPEDTPRMKGSARLLRTRACIVTPQMARDAPTTSPRQTRGNLRTRTMFCSTGFQFGTIFLPIPGILLNRILAVVSGETETGPIPVATMTVSRAAMIKMRITTPMFSSFSAFRSERRFDRISFSIRYMV